MYLHHPYFVAAVLAALIAVAGWMLERRRSAAAAAARRQLEAEAERNAQEAERNAREAENNAAQAKRSADEAKDLRAKLESEHRLREQVETARKTEHDWNRQLRREVVELHRTHSVLGRGDELKTLVLEVAMRLVDAKKGLLLAREDRDGDGRLDLIAYQGFENDPSDSVIAQRFADNVIERDETVRVDSPDAADHGEPSDQEIDNLLAIPIYIADDFSGVVVCANRDGGFEDLDDEVLLALGDHAGAVLESGRLRGELRAAYVTTVQMLADALEAKDPFLRNHSDEVCRYVDAVLEELDMDHRKREELVFASLLHDVGKIGISERILLKPGRLTPEERSIIELHPKIGYRLIEQVPALRSMTSGVLHHHERWDGGGYPSGLRGEEIPLEARIICIADCFSAMVSDRPYKAGMSIEDACAELERCAGTQFDPRLVRLFVDQVRKRPLENGAGRSFADALEDPETQARRHDGEPLLGYGQAGAVDNLTLLYARRRLHELAAAEAERARIQGSPFGVVLVQLDDLERINAEAGWAQGDAHVRSAAVVVGDAAGACEGIACRYDGSRLAVMVPCGAEPGPDVVAGRVSSALADADVPATVAYALCEDGEAGDAVIARAVTQLALAS
ncbi:MAG: hypothetical protein QOC55_367 [Thermoleophilaceae bacterium]|nr:hypothetical protein [Thermoleophilaceae bacterium]